MAFDLEETGGIAAFIDYRGRVAWQARYTVRRDGGDILLEAIYPATKQGGAPCLKVRFYGPNAETHADANLPASALPGDTVILRITPA